MDETAFTELSPWAGAWKRGRFGNTVGEAGILIAESSRAAVALLSLRKGHGAQLLNAARTWGVDLPVAPRWVRSRGRIFLWAGPGQWLVRGPGSYADLEADLADLAPHATFIDQSHARAALTVRGPRARDVLAKGFEIDLHPRAFRAGDVAMTAAAGISALIWQLDDAPTYEIAVPRSMTGSFWHWLSESAAEYGYGVADSA